MLVPSPLIKRTLNDTGMIWGMLCGFINLFHCLKKKSIPQKSHADNVIFRIRTLPEAAAEDDVKAAAAEVNFLQVEQVGGPELIKIRFITFL